MLLAMQPHIDHVSLWRNLPLRLENLSLKERSDQPEAVDWMSVFADLLLRKSVSTCIGAIYRNQPGPELDFHWPTCRDEIYGCIALRLPVERMVIQG